MIASRLLAGSAAAAVVVLLALGLAVVGQVSRTGVPASGGSP